MRFNSQSAYPVAKSRSPSNENDLELNNTLLAAMRQWEAGANERCATEQSAPPKWIEPKKKASLRS